MKLYSILYEDRRAHAHGDVFGSYLEEHPEKKEEILIKLGVSQDKLPEFLAFIDKQLETRKNAQSLNQIFAVLDGVKPMWYGGKTNMLLSTKLGRLIQRNLEKLGLISIIVGKHALIGKPENVNKAAVELERIKGKAENMDKQFHRVMGLALGYPEADVETFVSAYRY